MIGQIFQVATEFRFEIGSAVLGTKALQGHVDKLSGAVDKVSVGFARMGIAAAVNLGTGGGGLLGLITQSVKSWEHFRHAQLSLVNTMTANKIIALFCQSKFIFTFKQPQYPVRG